MLPWKPILFSIQAVILHELVIHVADSQLFVQGIFIMKTKYGNKSLLKKKKGRHNSRIILMQEGLPHVFVRT